MKESNTSVTKMVDILHCAIGMAGWLFVASVFPTQAQTFTSINLGGYLGVNYTGVANTYNAGYSMYVALLGRPRCRRWVWESLVQPWLWHWRRRGEWLH